MLADNDVTNDSRVRRSAQAAAQTGADVTLVALEPEGGRNEEFEGAVRIIRLPLGAGAGRKGAGRSHPGLLAFATKQHYLAAVARRHVRERDTASTIAKLTDGTVGTTGWRRRLLQFVTPFVAWCLIRRLHVQRVWFNLRARRYKAAARGERSILARAVAAIRQRVNAWRGWRSLLPETSNYEQAYWPVLSELAPDLVHVHDFRLLPLAVNLVTHERSRGRQVRWLYDAHEYLPGVYYLEGSRRRAAIRMERRLAHRADAVVTVAPALADRLQTELRLPTRPTVVLNAPSIEEGNEATRRRPSVRTEIGLPPDTPLVVYSGTVHEKRGLDTLIDALPDLPDVHLAITESRPYARTLASRAAELGAEDRCHLVPMVEADEVVAYLSSADVGAIPTLPYGNAEVALPTKLFEYLHAGLPVLVSDTGSKAEFVTQHRIGEVFPPGDASAATAALRRLLDHAASYGQALDDEQLRREYSWETQARILCDVYRSLGIAEQPEPSGAGPIETPRAGQTTPMADSITVAIGPHNSAGQAFAWARALERLPEVDTATAFGLVRPSAINFLADRRIQPSQWRDLTWQLRWAKQLLEGYSHLLLESGTSAFGTLAGGVFDGDLALLGAHDVRLGLVFHGSDIRDPHRHRELEPWTPFDNPADELTATLQRKVDALLPRVRSYDGPVLVTTLDLLDYLPDAKWLPVVVDVDLGTSSLPPMVRDRPVVVHAPAKRRLKGSEVVEPVLRELDHRGLIEFRTLEHLPHRDLLTQVGDADIVVDQFRIGDYGVAACEAMAAGRVVVGHVSERVRRRAPAPIPIMEATPDTITEVIEDLCRSPQAGTSVAEEGRRYVAEHHSGEVSARIILDALTGSHREVERATRTDP